MDALERLLAAYPDAFRGTELDVDANRQKMVKLCERVEGFLTDVAATPRRARRRRSPTMLREALASNTIGGRAGEESKWRAMAEDVRPGAGLVDAPRSGARGGRPAARRSLPPRVQPVLRSVSPARAATAAGPRRRRQGPSGRDTKVNGRWSQSSRSQKQRTFTFPRPFTSCRRTFPPTIV